MSMSEQAQRFLATPNAGGNSTVSEMLSYEVLGRYMGATLMQTEMEIAYYPAGGAKTDYTINLVCASSKEKRIVLGVSVTRAMTHSVFNYTQEEAERLLRKKLKGVIYSTCNSGGCWRRQILHVWSPKQENTNLVAAAYHALLQKAKSHLLVNTIILVTTAQNTPEIFTNQMVPKIPSTIGQTIHTPFRRHPIRHKKSTGNTSMSLYTLLPVFVLLFMLIIEISFPIALHTVHIFNYDFFM
ncbi:aac4 protein [Clonorchis sinensis]|uniref:Aac4 protein n=1 Tax=Clonorchis sinensis TaxID=79923 RepID=A0A419Q0T7_CLOSI|nr:aac4 protein [Clonorchis sinensis]